MRVFIAGGTGVVGRRAVPALVAHGHHVTALARSAEAESTLRRIGAEPVAVSLFEPLALRDAVAGHDLVVNLATSIPPFSKAARASAWKMNDRIRTVGSKNLVDAAIATGVGRYVQESVSFLYVDGGSAWIHEDHPTRPNSITASSVDAEAQVQRLVDHGAAALVLRFGMLYGPDSGHTRSTLRFGRMGFGSLPGARDAYVSSVSTDDAAAAVVAAATDAPPGTYNVVDDEPVTREEFDRVLAQAVGRRRLRPMPGLAIRLTGDKLDHFARSQRVSNRALRIATGWAPGFESVREGLPSVAERVRGRPSGDERAAGR